MVEPGSSLLERASELDELRRCVDAAAGGAGRVVTIEGEAGIGKTALLSAAATHAADRGFEVMSARGGLLERQSGFGVVRQLLQRPTVSAPPAVRRRLLRGAAGLAAPVLGLGRQPSPAAALSETQAEHGLYWLVAGYTERRPVAIAVDDAQWCDEASLRWLLYLIRRIEQMPVLLVLSVRTGEPGAPASLLGEIAAERLTVVMRPQPLSDSATATLLAQAYRSPVDERFSHACREWTHGNPLLVRELARELAAQGIDPDADSVNRMRALTPDSISRVTLVRLGRLPNPAVELARAVAVMGTDVELRHAAALANEETEAAGRAADALVDAGILEPGRPLRFVHPLLGAVIYQDLATGRRASEHKRAARLLAGDGASPEQAAPHLLASERAGDPWLVETLRAAAAREVARAAPEAGAVLLRRALAEPPDAALRAQVCLELGMAESSAGDPAALESLRDAERLSDDPGLRVRASLVRARLLLLSGKLSESVNAIEATLAAIGSSEPELCEQLEALLITAASANGDLIGRATAHLERVRAEAGADEPGGGPLAIPLAYHATADGASVRRSLTLARAALQDGKLIDEAPTAPDVYVVPISMLAICDELEEADRHYEHAIELARRSGAAPAYAAVSALWSWTSYLRGRLAEAENQARDALRIAVNMRELLAISGFASAHLASILIDRGELDHAAVVIDQHAGAEPSATWSRPLLFAHARYLAELREPARAAEEMLTCGQQHIALGITNPAFLPWRTHAALALHQIGDTERARELAAEELSLARRFGAARPIGLSLRTAALVNDEEGRIELLGESASLLSRSPARLEHARSLVELGAAMRRANQRSAAREPLNDGLELARHCGAAPLAARAADELRATGARPHTSRPTSRDQLTPAELRVCTMAARGMSNPEIAQALFVTRGTVESQLHVAYRKLGIRSRTQLGATLPASDSPATGPAARGCVGPLIA